MRFDVYGRFRLEVQRENDSWVVYRLPLGKRVKANDLIIPSTLEANEIATFVDDIFHELSGPGAKRQAITVISHNIQTEMIPKT